MPTEVVTWLKVIGPKGHLTTQRHATHMTSVGLKGNSIATMGLP